MPQVFDRETGQAVTLPPDQVQAGLLSGKLALDADGAPVALQGKDGKTFTATPDQVVGALQTGAYRLLTPHEEVVRRVQKEEAAKGLGGSIGEGLESGANQLLLGIPEALREAQETPEQREEREARQEYHGAARMLGGAVGVAGSLLTGGELFKAADLAGQAVERAVMPATELAEASLAHRLAGTAVNYAAQGALYSSPQALIQGVVGGDWKKAGETMMWGIGAGALLGGTGALLKEGAGALAEKASGLLSSDAVREKLDAFANESALKAVGAERGQLNKLSEENIGDLADYLHENGVIQPGRSRQELGDIIEQMHGKEGKSIGEAISRLDELAELPHDLDLADIKAQDPWSEEKLGKVRAARERGDTMEPIRVVRNDDGELVVDDGLHRVAIAKERGEKTIKASLHDPEREHIFDAMHEFLKPGEIGDALKTALDSPELRMPMNADSARALDTVIQSANKIPTTRINGRDVVSFTDAQAFVSSLRRRYAPAVEKALNEGGVKGPIAVTPLDEMKSAAYQAARDALHKAADRVAVAAKEPEVARSLVAAKQNYAKLSKLEQFAATLDRQAAGNRKMSLTDVVHMGNGPLSAGLQSIGAGIGGMLGGGPGALIGQQAARIPGMALDYLAKHWMEDKGMIILSHIAKRAAKEGPEVFSAVIASEGAKRLEASMGTVRDTVKNLAIRGVEETSARKPEHMRALLGDTSGLSHEQQFAKLSDRLTDLATNPQAMAAATSELTAPFSAASPDLGAAYQSQLISTVNYLYNALPKPAAPPLPFAPRDFEPSRSELLAFHDKAEIVANPMATMKHIARGTLSDAHMDALNANFPRVADQMRTEILKLSAEHPDMLLPLQERTTLAKFLGVPIDGLSQHILALQAAFVPPAPQSNAAAQSARHPRSNMRKIPSQASAFSGTQGPAEPG